jgi:hypothetical protein
MKKGRPSYRKVKIAFTARVFNSFRHIPQKEITDEIKYLVEGFGRLFINPRAITVTELEER